MPPRDHAEAEVNQKTGSIEVNQETLGAIVDIASGNVNDTPIFVAIEVGESNADKAAREQAEKEKQAREEAARKKAAAAKVAKTAQNAPKQAVPTSDIQSIAQQLVVARWGAHEWPAMQQLMAHESGSNPYAKNPTSGACGIPQALPCSKLLKVIGSLDNIQGQIQWMVDYVADRYGSPSKAWHFWQHIAPTYDFNKDGRADGNHWY